MNKFVAIIFPDEARAYEGVLALRELHREGSILLYGETVVVKDEAGKLSIREAKSAGGLATTIGAVTGGLLGLLAGPFGTIAGLTGGALLGGLKDIFDAGISGDFIKVISEELTPGRSVVIAEIDEGWTSPLDIRIAPLGGVVVRTFRHEVEEAQIRREINDITNELTYLREQLLQEGKHAGAELKVRIELLDKSLAEASKRIQGKAKALREETEAVIVSLQAQAEGAVESAGKRIEQRIADIQEDYDKRAAKLEQAWEQTKAALR
ncbi:DUF1269 domain-containing protein [Stenotrophomonas maltophilia]